MAKLKEGIDFYIENGFYVFTAHYLLNRGYCCKNGCRHCPYQSLEKQPQKHDFQENNQNKSSDKVKKG